MAYCPECLSDNLACVSFDFGACSQTGFHDAGERFECRACGATGDAEEVLAVLPANVRKPALADLRYFAELLERAG